MSEKSVSRSVYRALLRQARVIDSAKDPRFRFLVVGKPSSAYDRRERRTMKFHTDTFSEKLYRFTGGQYYRTTTPKVTLQEIVREAFQDKRNADDFVQLQEAFLALRYFGDVVDLKDELLPPPEPSESVPTEGSSLHVLTDYDNIDTFSGKLLVTHPVSCLDQQEFHRSVCVLVEQHGLDPDTAKPDEAVTGYIINKPLRKKSRQRLTDILRHPLADRLNNLGLWTGGPLPSLTILHDSPDVEDSVEVAPGMYIYQLLKKSSEIEKTLDHILELLEDGTLKDTNMRVIYGCCGWDRQQLLSELERGVWFLTDNPDDLAAEAPENMWPSYLARFGGEYKEIASMPDFSRALIQKLSLLQKEAFVQAMEEERRLEESSLVDES